MSQWTHVNAQFRLSSLLEEDPIKKIQDLIGPVVSWDCEDDEMWDNSRLPMGSEGSLTYMVYENPHVCYIGRLMLSFVGDLRDYDNTEECFEKVFSIIEDLHSAGYYVRDSFMVVDVEYGRTVCASIETGDDRSPTRWKFLEESR